MHDAISYYLSQHEIVKSILIQMSFVMLAVLFMSLFWRHDTVVSSQDFLFNYQRLEEVWHDLLHLQLPQFNESTALPYGLATPTMYPWLLLAPFALIVPIVSSLHVFLLVYIVAIYLGLNIAFHTYRSSKFAKATHHTLIASYIFAFMYVISEFSMDTFFNSDVGMLYAGMLLPLVFFGWQKWIRNGSWLEMTIGLCLISFCHIVSIIVALGLIILLTAISYRHIKFTRIKVDTLFRVLISFVLISAIIWLPILYFICTKDITLSQALPTTKEIGKAHLRYKLSPLSTIGLVIFPAVAKDYTLGDLCGLILGACFWKRLSRSLRFYEVLAVIFLFFSLKPITTFFRNHRAFNGISYISRCTVSIHLLSTLILIYLLIAVLPHKLHYNSSIPLILIAIIATGLNLYGYQNYLLASMHPKNSFKKSISSFVQDSSKHIVYNGNVYNKPLLHNKDLENNKLIHFQSHYDYLPKIYQETYQDTNSLIIGNNAVTPSLKFDKIRFHTNKSMKQIRIPIAIYHHQNIQIYVDNKRVPIKFSKSHMLLLNKVSRGMHIIRIQEPIMWYRWLSILLMLLGLVYLLIRD